MTIKEVEFESTEYQGWDAWFNKFKPIKNHLDKYAGPDGSYMFETYGEEYDFVKEQDNKYVWTWVQGDMSDVIIAGHHWVNRLGYYVATVPWDDEFDSCLLSVEEECECYDEEKFDWGADPDCKTCEGNGTVTRYVD
jgi:hypothetical protein